MPDQQEAPIQELAPEQAELKQQFEYHTAMAFGEVPTVSATQQENIVTNPENPDDKGASVAATQPANDFDIVDPSEYLKAELGIESVDAIKAAFAELQELKSKAQTPAEIKFANDEAKKWFDYFREGKEDELYNALHGRKQVKNLETYSDEQKLKLYIQMQNPRFDQELIDDEYNSLYKIDEERLKNPDTDEVDPLKLRKERMRMQQRIENDIAKANDFFGQYKTKIELQDISAPKQEIDQAYQDYQASIAQSQQEYANVIVPSVNSLKETDVQFSVKVDDPNNQMQFELSVVPDVNDFNTAKNDALDYSGYITKTFYDDKGNFNAAKLNRAILLEKNFEKYAQSIARQAVNAERKRVIAKEAGGGGVVRNFNVNPQQMTELQKEAEKAFAV